MDERVDPWVILYAFWVDNPVEQRYGTDKQTTVASNREWYLARGTVPDLLTWCVDHIRHREICVLYLHTLARAPMYYITPEQWRRFRCRALWVNAFHMEKRNRYIESVCSADQQRSLFALKLAVHLVARRRRDFFCMMHHLKRAFDELVQEICGDK